MAAEIVDVLFIGGASRTGSTLLALLLGSLPGHLSVGEVRYLWLRGLLGNQLCGCGEPFRTCPFWEKVIGEAIGPVEELPVERYTALWRRAATPKAVLRGLSPFDAARRRDRDDYLELLHGVLLAMHRESGGAVIVDSSKYASDCLLLKKLPHVRVHAVHIVRDSRAVAYSWQRTKPRPEIHWRAQDMSRFSPWRSSFDWGVMNAAMEVVGRSAHRYDRIRYEDLACDPVATLTPLLPPEMEQPLAKVVSGSEVRGAGSHTVSGNPLRFERGPLKVRPDVEWLSRMDGRDRSLVTALTWPLLLRYGYPIRPSAEGGLEASG